MTTTDEQFPYGAPPAGYHWEWQPDERGRWQVLPADEEPKPCRYFVINRTACGEPSVARVDRSSTSSKRRPNWWHYCGEHLYGRRIRDGRIEHCVARPDPPPTMADAADPIEQAVAVLRRADADWYAMVNASVSAADDGYLRHQIRALAAAGLLRTAAPTGPAEPLGVVEMAETLERAKLASLQRIAVPAAPADDAVRPTERAIHDTMCDCEAPGDGKCRFAANELHRAALAALRQAGGQA